MQITFSAPDLRIDLATNNRPRLLSPPAEMVVELPDTELQALVESGARARIEEMGAALEGIHVDLRTTSPRSAELVVHAKVKKFVSVTIIIRGHIALDESLIATVSKLSADGEGMLAKAIVPMIQGKLAPFEGRRFPLAGKLPPWLAVKDVMLITGAVHRVIAKLATAG